MTELPEHLFRQWVHAHEEDTPDEIVYHPAGHPLPPARGRTGLEFRPGGEFVDVQIGPTDARKGISGRWQLEAPGRLKVCFDEPARSPETLEIVHVDADILKLRRHPTKESP